MNRLPEYIKDKIKQTGGIVLTEELEPAVLEFVNSRTAHYGTSIESYCNIIETNPSELEKLLNAATVKETYFFREECQFDFINKTYFKSGKYSDIKIWCAGCSTGEEALSVYALAKYSGVKAEVTASDINARSLEVFRKGFYSDNSLRADGQKFHSLINDISEKTEKGIQIKSSDLSSIRICNINLKTNAPYPFVFSYFDLIILRNVFIYFSKETMADVLKRLHSVLKKDGILLLSINEIASIPNTPYFDKVKDGSVYYLKKADPKAKENPSIINMLSKAKDKLQVQNIPGILKNAVSGTKPDSETACKADKKFYARIMTCISKGKYSEAQELLSSRTYRACELEYKYFAQGFIQHLQKNYKDAEVNFYKAFSLNPELWPASVMLAFAYKRAGKTEKSLDLFKQSFIILDEYVKSEKTCYNFMMDFDPAYFLEICRKNIDGISKACGE